MMKSVSIIIVISLVLFLGACAVRQDEVPKETRGQLITYSKEAAKETVSAESESGTKETAETVPVQKTTEAESSGEETASVIKKDLVRFFGHGTVHEVAEINRRTLESVNSGLYDVLHGHLFTYEEVLQFISTYSLPERAFYDDAPMSAELRSQISDYRNLKVLQQRAPSEKIDFQCGILTENTSVRSFPTKVRATDHGLPEDFDWFQETMLPIASGVLILHTTADGAWSFVQGQDYFGWIESDSIGFCSFGQFQAYLVTDNFLVSLKGSNFVNGVNIRLGTIIPYLKRLNDEFVLKMPMRDDEGNFYCDYIPVEDNGDFSDGFLEYSTENVLKFMDSLISLPYGWGDTDEKYDCSSTVGLMYRCFGYFLPRNTSAMKYFGGTVVNVNSMVSAEKLKLIDGHPGAILIMPGHAMLYEETRKDDVTGKTLHSVIHNTSGYCTSSDGSGFQSINRVVRSDLETMYRTNGEAFLDRVSTVLLFDQNIAEKAE